VTLKMYFSIITPVFSVTWSRNHADLGFKK